MSVFDAPRHGYRHDRYDPSIRDVQAARNVLKRQFPGSDVLTDNYLTETHSNETCNNNRFYYGAVLEMPNDRYVAVVKYGRIGQNQFEGKFKEQGTFSSFESAYNALERQLNKKRKGKKCSKCGERTNYSDTTLRSAEENQLTPEIFGKLVGQYPQPPNNPLPVGGFMDEGFEWTVNQAEEFDYTKITYMVRQALEDFKGTYYSHEFEEAMRQMKRQMEDGIQRSDSELQSLADSIVKGKKKMDAETFNAQMDGEKLIVSSRDFNDGSMMVGVGTSDLGSDDPDFMEMMIKEDGEIEYFTMPTGVNHYQRMYKPKPAHYGKMKTQNETNKSAGGDFIRTDGDGKHAETFNAPNIKFCNGCNKRNNFEDGECNLCGAPEGYEGFKPLIKRSSNKKLNWLNGLIGLGVLLVGYDFLTKKVLKSDTIIENPDTGSLKPADYEELVVQSTGYYVPIIPVGLDPAFMGSRFHALPTDRLVYDDPNGIGAHIDVAMNPNTNFLPNEQSLVMASEAPGQSPYNSMQPNGQENPDFPLRVIHETTTVSLDGSVAKYIPQDLSGYTGQQFIPTSVYEDMLGVGISGKTPAFTVPESSGIGSNRFGSRIANPDSMLTNVVGVLDENVNGDYTDGSMTMSLSAWSMRNQVQQISDTEAIVIERGSGSRKMIRRV